MGSLEWITVGGMTVNILIGLLFWLLKHQLQQQEDSMKSLFKIHHEDVANLNDVRLSIAENHYKKAEVLAIVSDLKDSMRSGFHDLGLKFDNLADQLARHMALEDRRKSMRNDDMEKSGRYPAEEQ